MLNRLIPALILMFLSFGSVASPIVINDEYWGAAPTRDSYTNRDVIGNPDLFDINRMEVEFNGNFMDVVIYTNYQNGTYNTYFGDLFISTDGWNPNASGSHYANDNAATGEDWELVYDNNVGLVGGDFDILLSDSFNNPNRSIFRGGQEVRRDPNGGGSVYNDNSYADFSNAGPGGFISYHIDMSSILANLTGSEIGLHWNMTCGNDTIEGMVSYISVDESGSLWLFSIALMGLLISRRR